MNIFEESIKDFLDKDVIDFMIHKGQKYSGFYDEGFDDIGLGYGISEGESTFELPAKDACNMSEKDIVEIKNKKFMITAKSGSLNSNGFVMLKLKVT